MNQPLAIAVDILGGQKKAAERLSAIVGRTIHQPAVHYWLNKAVDGIPPQYCPAIEQATNGAVTREQLRPDIFPPSRGA